MYTSINKQTITKYPTISTNAMRETARFKQMKLKARVEKTVVLQRLEDPVY